MFARFMSTGTFSAAHLFAAFLAAALIAAPLPVLVPGAMAQSAKTETKSATKTTPKKAKRAATPTQQTPDARMRQSGAEWKTAKVTGKFAKGMKWPQYWSAYKKRLKAGG